MLEIVRLADTVFHRNHAHHCGIHFRCGVERFGRYVDQQLHIEKILQHHAQAAVVVAFRRGNHALDHFFLQHKVHIDDIVRHLRQLEQKRRGNVVRQVADDFLFACDAVEIKLQYIAFVNHQFIRKRQRFQTAYDVAVDFDNVQAVQFFCQRFGNRRQTRADFNHDIIRLRAYGVDNIADDPRVL